MYEDGTVSKLCLNGEASMTAVLSKFGLRRQRLRKRISLPLLVVYVLGISGLPAGTVRVQSGCCCDKQLQASGNCCCARKPAPVESNLPPCCQRKLDEKAQAARSCCQTGGTKKQGSRNKRELALRSCSCGPVSDEGYLLNTDPRVLSSAMRIDYDRAWDFSGGPRRILFTGPKFSPDPPPPKSFSV